ncbi:hypothetical protein [Halosegnis longus]|uniref:hypothetical protein n=1 Tax=Halosegnis longus TaxID=2216012 RepID=UPI00096ACB27|nr:hypothetical protein [Salella cibi]
MPSRRDVLAAGALGVAALAGCTALDDGPPRSARWHHGASAVFDTDSYVYANLHVPTLRANSDRLPEELQSGLDRARDFSEAIALDDVNRLLATGYGRPQRGQAGLTLVATGDFDADAIDAEIADTFRPVEDGLVTPEGTYRGYQCYASAPALGRNWPQFQGPDQPEPPDFTFGVGYDSSALVASVTLGLELNALDGVHAAIDARTGTGPRLTERAPVRHCLSVTNGHALVAGVSETGLATLQQETTGDGERALALAKGLVFGYRFDPDRLRVAVVFDPSDLLSRDRLRSLLDELFADEDEEGPDLDIERIGVARDGRVIYADIAVGPEAIERLNSGTVTPTPTAGVWI